MTTALIITAVVVGLAIAAYFLLKGIKKDSKPSVVQEPSKPEKSVCEGCNNFEACIDCDNGSRWAHIPEPKEEHQNPKECIYAKDNYTDEDRKELCEGCQEECKYRPKEDFPIPSNSLNTGKNEPFVPLVYLDKFKSIVDIKEGTKTYEYLAELYFEACAQYGDQTKNGLPILFKEENFPQIYNFYGDNGSEDKAFKTLVGWLFAMQLVELRPQDRTAIYKIGYEIGGCDKDSKLYGWKFKCDPNICRMVASAIYAAMRGVCKPNIETMREECGGISISDTIEEVRESDSFDLDHSYYIDLREFMPTAPGPYAPGYKDRSKIGGYPYPNDGKTDDYNLAIDRAIRDMVIESFNLSDAPDNDILARTVQAIADKDANYNHLFGRQRKVDDYVFNPVFTKDDLGQEVYPSLAKELCEIVDDVLHIGSYQRCILQGNDSQETPPQYGRLRPGCSWQVEAHRHSDSDDTQNVLVDFYIEDNDGNPTGYYNQDGEWVNKDGIHSPEEYNDVMKDELWANSYPSGHSAGIMSCCLLLIELLPRQTDKILAAANSFAVNRTIARYHWNSDTIQGRVLATCVAPIIRCCADWKERFEKAKECLK